MSKYSKELFKQLITTTFNEWYYDRTLEYDHLDYFELIQKSHEIETTLGPYLFDEETCLLTTKNCPFIDLGDKPSSYGPNR